jgi:MGT family glycosyltransferase
MRRYLVALVDGGGNVPPELHAVRTLVERGHAVTVLAEDSVARDVLATGASFCRWQRAPNRPDRRPEHDPARDWECVYPWQLVERLVDTVLVGPAEAYARDVQEAIAETRAESLISSMFCLGGMVAAEAARLPYAVMLPNVYPLPADGMPAFGIGLQPARGIWGRLRDRALNTFTERLWSAKGLAGLNALRARHGLAPLPRFLDQVRRAKRQLVQSSEAFDFPAELPETVRYVGPVLDDPVWAGGAWTPPEGSDPLVLVALSSTFQDQRTCLQTIVDALGTLRVRGLVTAGPAIDPSSLRPRDNVTVVASLPHTQVLPHASVVVTHGGHGTVVKALAAGVPLVILPHGRDQADTAARVTARGAGLVVSRTARADAIARAVRRVLDDGAFSIAAQALGESILRDVNDDDLIRQLEDLPRADV